MCTPNSSNSGGSPASAGVPIARAPAAANRRSSDRLVYGRFHFFLYGIMERVARTVSYRFHDRFARVFDCDFGSLLHRANCGRFH